MKVKLNKLKAEYKKIQEDLSDPLIVDNPEKLKKLSQRQSELEQTVQLINRYENNINERKETRKLLEEDDIEIRNAAEEDIAELDRNISKLKDDLEIILLPKDERDSKDVIMEIRAGAGGDEAGLFAADLFRMYSRYAEKKGWRVEILSANRTSIGGFKEVIFSMKGRNVFREMKYERGVHRVQRIPETEKSGRIHTSTATVAVLAEAEDVDIKINPKDLRIDTFCASGHGGQSVNTTYSAIRITHLPTNIVVSCQDERSQLRNKEKAMKVLKTRILDIKEEEKQRERGDERKVQVGTGDRSEKIRTYNFPQDRITDHRIKFTTKNLEGVLDGNIDNIIKNLINEDNKIKLGKESK